jgi:hypothetical protein
MYRSRKEAKQVARNDFPNDHLSAYRCPTSGTYHIGHLPAVVREGIADRSNVRSNRRRAW